MTNVPLRGLVAVYWLKIIATLLLWTIPLLFLSADLLRDLALPERPLKMLLQMLGWAYLALCVGYGFGLAEARRGRVLLPPIYVGLVSNGGACLFLLYYGLTGAWEDLALIYRLILWQSVLGTALISAGLYHFGLRDRAEGAS